MHITCKYYLVFNAQKTHVKAQAINFFGCLYDANGVHLDPGKVNAVHALPAPTNVTELQEFLSLVTYLSPFIKLQPDECIMSYDVSALFTSIPIDPAIKTIKKHLEEDKDLSKRTSMTVNHIICLLEFCLRNTYFSFQGRYYEQTEGAAMGSPISPLVANFFMEEFEVQAISTSTVPRTLWKRFVDNTFTIIKKNNRESFLQHLNSINPKIQFTCEETREDGSMPFLDILVTPEEDGSLKTSVFRKTTNTDLYLQWDSHHTIPSKYSVAGTLYHRASTVCSTPQLLQEEEEHLFIALTRCKYPTWDIKRARMRSQNPNSNRRKTNQTGQKNNKSNLYMVVPYHQGLSENATNLGFWCSSKEDKPSEASSWLPRTRILSQTKVESYIDINAVNMGVMKNTLVNLLEILQKGSRNTRKPLPLYLTTVTPQAITSISTILL